MKLLQKVIVWIPFLVVAGSILYIHDQLTEQLTAAPVALRCYAFVDAHQGQDVNDWALPGTTNFYPGGDLVQVGSISWTGTPATNGRIFITYPITYGGGNTPIVLAQAVGPAGNNVVVSTSPMYAAAYLDWRTADNTKVNYVQLFWTAIGRDAECD